MNPADAARVQAEQHALAEQASFFGYDLSQPGWQYTEVSCPAMPADVLLQYRRKSAKGSTSVFTALVPRGTGRVQVVPVLYRNATPFQSAVGSRRSLAVFNRAVPSSVAEKELQPSGAWLQLALCYAEMVGAEPRVPRETDASPALLRAPAPTLRISEEDHREGVIFTDRSAQHRYMVWDIDFDSHGRATAASATPLAEYEMHAVNGKTPTERPFPTQPEPKVIPLPPTSQPTTKPIPQ